MDNVTVYDTTLRDGTQQEGISLSVTDKLRICRILDDVGVDIIEGGWPGAIPKDTTFFEQAAGELTLHHARLAAFGSTCKPGVAPGDDPQVVALHQSGAPVITLVAKSDPRHVELALRTTREENLRMVEETVRYLTGLGHEVMVDAEHFFDGLRADPDYGLEVLAAAARAGASAVIPCDTNGGSLPDGIAAAITRAREFLDERGHSACVLGIHTHNDTGCAVANALAAVDAGARQVQGTVNGYGERTGNANLLTCVANLQLKKGYQLIEPRQLETLSSVAHEVSEIVNIAPFAREPYVGASAFAHKGGLHASAIRVDPNLYQHIDPGVVGNDMRMIVSEMAGRSSIELKARDFGVDLSSQPELTAAVVRAVKEREAHGYTYDAADASFGLLLRSLVGEVPRYAEVDSWRASVRSLGGGDTEAEATVKVRTAIRRRIRTAEGNGPVNALDRALHSALREDYPQIEEFELVDFKVRILDQDHAGTDAAVRVLITTSDHSRTWSTVGVGTDVIEASWEAMEEAIVWGLMSAGVAPVTGQDGPDTASLEAENAAARA